MRDEIVLIENLLTDHFYDKLYSLNQSKIKALIDEGGNVLSELKLLISKEIDKLNAQSSILQKELKMNHGINVEITSLPFASKFPEVITNRDESSLKKLIERKSDLKQTTKRLKSELKKLLK